MKKTVFALILIPLVILTGCSKFVRTPKTDDKLQPSYVKACDLLKEGDLEEAYALFTELGDYKDSAYHASKFAYLPTEIVQEDDGFGEDIVTYHTVYEYNEYGELVFGEGKYTNDEGPGYNEKHSYNADGQLIKSETQSEAGYSTLTYEYDNSGSLTKRVGATDGANVGGITLYTYDKDGRCTKAENSSYLGTDTDKYASEQPYHTDTVVYTYDAHGNCIKAVSSYGDGQITYTAEYNENNMPTVIKSSDNDGFATQTTFEYDTDGRCTKIKTPYDETVFSYESGALPSSAIRTRDGGKPCNITYTYKLFYIRGERPQLPFFMDEHMSVFKV